MIYAKFNENGHITEFVREEVEGYIQIPNLNCRLINGVIVDETEENEQREIERLKLIKLDNWFKTDYAKYEQMFNRRHFLAIEDVIVDAFRGKTYHNLGELYREGEDVAKEIRELKESLKTDTNQLTNDNQSVIMEVEN